MAGDSSRSVPDGWRVKRAAHAAGLEEKRRHNLGPQTIAYKLSHLVDCQGVSGGVWRLLEDIHEALFCAVV